MSLGHWTYCGEVLLHAELEQQFLDFHNSILGRPRLPHPLSICGWVVREVGRQPSDWYMLWSDQQFPLLLTPSGARILALASSAGFRCWCAGRVFFTSLMVTHQMLVMDSVTLWIVGGGAPRYPPPLAAAIWESDAARALVQLLAAPLLQPAARDFVGFHPMAYANIPMILGGAAFHTISAMVCVLANLEILSLSHSALCAVETTAPLGHSGQRFRPAEVGEGPPPKTANCRGTFATGTNPWTLVSAALQLVACHGGRTLFVTERQTLHGLFKLCAQWELPAALLLTRADFRRHREEVILVTAPEVLVSAAPHWRRMNLSRVVLVSWPQCLAKFGPTVPPMLPHATVLALALEHEVREQLEVLRNPGPWLRRLCWVLGLPPAAAGNPAAVCQAVRLRHLGFPSGCERPRRALTRLVGPVEVPGLQLSDPERRLQDTGSEHRARAQQSLYFGEILRPPRAANWVQTPEELVPWFEARGLAPSPYARRAMQQCPEQIDCCICWDSTADAVGVCGHWFCEPCLARLGDGGAELLACPVCKTGLLPRPVLVYALRQQLHRPLWGALVPLCRGRRSIVLVSCGDLHVRAAVWLERQHRLPALAWRGTPKQLLQIGARFDDARELALFVDPLGPSCAWSLLPAADQVVVLGPLFGCCAACVVERLLLSMAPATRAGSESSDEEPETAAIVGTEVLWVSRETPEIPAHLQGGLCRLASAVELALDRKEETDDATLRHADAPAPPSGGVPPGRARDAPTALL